MRSIVKQEPFAILYSDNTLTVKNVRASYAHIFKPFQGPPDKETGRIPPPRWGIVGLMPKTAEHISSMNLIRVHIMQMIRDAKLQDLPATNKFLRDGDLVGKAEYKGMYTINAGEMLANPPQLRSNVADPNTGKPRVLVRGVDDAVIQSGYWVNILIRPWFQNNNYGKKVNAGLVAVQFVRKDEVFGTGRISEEEVDESFGTVVADDDSGFEDIPFDL